jgi:hypothetical protein
VSTLTQRAAAKPKRRQRFPLTQPQCDALKRSITAAGCHSIVAFRDGRPDEIGVMDRGECVGTVRRGEGGLIAWTCIGIEYRERNPEAAVKRITQGWAA